MNKQTLRIITFLSLALIGLSARVNAQTITARTASAKGHGSIIVKNLDSRTITSILVILKEDGSAALTLYTDLQLLVQGTWSPGKSLSQGIDLQISGGIVNDGGKGTGKLYLRKDGKSIKRLTITAKSADGMSVRVVFVADNSSTGNSSTKSP